MLIREAISTLDPSTRERLRRLRALVVDVDGVLTDGGMYYGPQGDVLKKFNTKDGMGLVMLRERGLRVALMSGEDTEIIRRRAEKLGIVDLYLGIKDKGLALKGFLSRYSLSGDEVAYMGDDVNDLPALRLVAAGFAPSDAVEAVRSAVHFISEKKGGEGAVREMTDFLLKVRE